MNLLGSNPSNPSTGELGDLNDSVQISYDDLRIVNSKLIQLEYEKKINRRLKDVISNDSIMVVNMEANNKRITEECKKVTRQRNVCLGVTIVAIIVSIFSFMK